MSKKTIYTRPEIRTLGAAQLLESLGPVSCGSANLPTEVVAPPVTVGRGGGSNRFN